MFGLTELVLVMWVEEERTRCLVVSNRVGEDFCEIEEDPAAFVEHLDARFDFEVFAHGDVERVQRRFAFPEEIGDVEHVGG